MTRDTNPKEADVPVIEFGEIDFDDAMVIEDIARQGEEIEAELQTFLYEDFPEEESPSERIIRSIADRCLPKGRQPQIYVMKT